MFLHSESNLLFSQGTLCLLFKIMVVSASIFLRTFLCIEIHKMLLQCHIMLLMFLRVLGVKLRKDYGFDKGWSWHKVK